MQESDHRLVGIKRAMNPAVLDVVNAFGGPGFDDAPLLRRKRFIGGRKFREQSNDSPGNLYFKLVARLDSGLSPNTGWKNMAGFFIDCDGHGDHNYCLQLRIAPLRLLPVLKVNPAVVPGG